MATDLVMPHYLVVFALDDTLVCCPQYGTTPLMQAARMGDVGLMQTLFSTNLIDVNVRDHVRPPTLFLPAPTLTAVKPLENLVCMCRRATPLCMARLALAAQTL